MLNNINNSLNIITNNRRTIKLISDSFKGLAKNIIKDSMSFFSEYSDVFSGTTAAETTKLISRIHHFGVVMRENNKVHRTFNRQF